MANILGKNLSLNKPIYISLQAIYGIGKEQAINICIKNNINGLKKSKDITEKEIRKLTYYIQKNLIVNEQLKKKEQSSLKNLYSLKTYRGFRHKLNLPVRGQKTSRNAKTQKIIRRSRFLR